MITLLLMAAAPANLWTVTAQSDPFTDQEYVTLISEQGKNMIAVKCVKGADTVTVSVINGVNMGGAPLLRMTPVRVDATPPSNYSFGFLDYVAESYNDGMIATKVLSAKSKIAFRFPLSRNKTGTTDAMFDATNLPSKAATFKKKCSEIGFKVP